MLEVSQVIVPVEITLGLVRAHYDDNEEYFKKYLMQLVDFLNKENEQELAEFCLAQARLIPTFDVMDFGETNE